MEKCDALVIGAGPAGLMAADALAQAGRRVILVEARPSPARKFLMAGKSGLNLTKDAPPAAFLDAYDEAAGWLAPMITSFGPPEVQDWARGLGQPVFTGSSGRVFPQAMKASPLLRAWLARLADQGVELRTGWRWQGWQGQAARFDTPAGTALIAADVIVLALGGASWARLGSDGAWRDILLRQGVPVASFQPANMGFRVDWSHHMAPYFGTPVKGVALSAGELHARGEFVLSARGIEGGGVYAVSRALREGAPLVLDLAPDLQAGEIARRLAAQPGRLSLSNRLRRALGLAGVRRALLRECAGPPPAAPEALARLIKALPVPLAGPRPLDEAISIAGGIRREALTAGLEIKALPGVFAAGEMLDWEAPTGGYLLTACLATGRWAGCAAARL
ncbi:aminoacetone oxidase family FAD-binding enzyme [Rhodobacteraceae bacterium WD3A24]|nr:aminoacetone oxidase family FAD-binding enzyme [Rhodobacteraceae bacterium WD3A24]